MITDSWRISSPESFKIKHLRLKSIITLLLNSLMTFLHFLLYVHFFTYFTIEKCVLSMLKPRGV